MKFWQLMQLTQQAHARRQEEANGDAPGGEGQKGGETPPTDNSGGKPAGEAQGDKGDKDSKMSDGEAKLLREVMQRKEENSTLTKQNEELNKKLDDLSARFDGVDPEKFRNLEKEAQERREKELEGNKDWASLKADLEERHQSTIEQMKTQHSEALTAKLGEVESSKNELQQQLEKQNAVIEELTIGNQFGTSGYISEELSPSSTKVRTLYGSHFDVVDGQVVPFDKPRGAEKRHPLVDGDGKPLSFDVALQKIVDSDPDGDSIKRAKQRSGSDSGSANRPGQQPTTKATGVSRIAMGLNKG